MTVKRRSVEDSMFVDRTMKTMKLDHMDRAVQVVADMAYHGSDFQYEHMNHSQQHIQMQGVEQMQQHAIQQMLHMDTSPASSPEPMDCMDVAAHHVPTHRFISSCVSY